MKEIILENLVEIEGNLLKFHFFKFINNPKVIYFIKKT